MSRVSQFLLRALCDPRDSGSSSRDMGDQGSVLVREKDVPKHRGFEVELFTRTDGDWQIKLVLSSYTFMNNGAMGFPGMRAFMWGVVRCGGCAQAAPPPTTNDSLDFDGDEKTTTDESIACVGVGS